MILLLKRKCKLRLGFSLKFLELRNLWLTLHTTANNSSEHSQHLTIPLKKCCLIFYKKLSNLLGIPMEGLSKLLKYRIQIMGSRYSRWVSDFNYVLIALNKLFPRGTMSGPSKTKWLQHSQISVHALEIILPVLCVCGVISWAVSL